MTAPMTGQPNGIVPAPDYNDRPYGAEKALNDQAAGVPAEAAAPPLGGMQAAMQGLLMSDEPAGNLLDDPPDDSPLTTGLPIGAGPGPEIFGGNQLPRVARVLDSLAISTGNPAVVSIAAEAAARNL